MKKIKRMTYNEFMERTIAVMKARKIFMPHLTNNISIAFEMYQKILSEEDMDVFVSTGEAGNRMMTPLDDYERLKCPECGIDMRLLIGFKGLDGIIYPTTWHCEKCLADYYSDKSIKEWMDELQRK